MTYSEHRDCMVAIGAGREARRAYQRMMVARRLARLANLFRRSVRTAH